ncbi:MAG TPA: PQQ-binding-like beta-propeller repeat protein [Armatimonadota bacterium]|jgi:outer membrane protein assembly factor BamB
MLNEPARSRQSRLAHALACALVAASLASGTLARAADWPMHRRDPQRSGRSPETLKLPLTQAWTAKTGEMGIFASPVVSDGVVYVGSREKGIYSADGKVFIRPGALFAFDAKTGDQKWKLDSYEGQRLQWFWSGPTVTKDAIFFTNQDGNLYKVSKAGKVLWRFKTGGTDTSSPLVFDGLVYFGSAWPNTSVYAVNADTGKLKWKTPTTPEGSTGDQNSSYVYSSPALAGELVIVGANNGIFFGMDRKTGDIRWRFDIKNKAYFFTPTVVDGRVILASGDYDRTVNAVSITNGKQEGVGWKYTADLPKLGHIYISSTATDGKSVFIVMGYPESFLIALDAQKGTFKWRVSLGYAGFNDVSSSPAVAGDFIFVGGGAEMAKQDTKSGRLLVINRDKGTVAKAIDLPANVVASPTVAEGMVYIGALDGTFYAFKAASFSESGVTPTRVTPVAKTKKPAK